jgi:hypothetical protein
LLDSTVVIETWLQQSALYGWLLQKKQANPAQGWLLIRHEQQLFVYSNAHWLCFMLPIPLQNESIQLKSLLQASRQYFLCKYSQERTGELVLQLELPLEDLDWRYCCQAFEAFNVYGQRDHNLEEAKTVKMPNNLSLAQDSSPQNSSSMVEVLNVYRQPDVEPTEPREMRATIGMADVAGAAFTIQGVNQGYAISLKGETNHNEFFPRSTLIQYFKSIASQGWGLRHDPKVNHWQAVYKSQDERSFDVYLSFDQSWLYFQMPLTLKATHSYSSSHRLRLQQYLLQLNQNIYWVKLGLDEQEQVLLLLDIPIESLTLRRFQRATQTLAAYANSLFDEIRIMVNLEQDKHLSQFF